MTHKITVETLRSGQPRPYADHCRVVRVKFEYHFQWLGDPKDPRSEWKPWLLKQEQVDEIIKTLMCGWPGINHEMRNWADTKVHYLREVALLDPENLKGASAVCEGTGIWEFMTTSAYTG